MSWRPLALLTLAACRNAAPPPPDVPAPRVDVAPPDVAAAPDVAEAPDAPAARRVVVTLSGDLMLHRGVLDTLRGHRVQGGVAWALNWLTPLVTPREVALAWLDSPLTDAHRAAFSGTPPALGVPRDLARDVARDLGRVGLDGLCLATHHAYDQTAEGLRETTELLRGAGLGVAGAGATEEEAWRAWETERDGVRVAFLCFTQHIQMAAGAGASQAAQSLDGSRALAAVAAARARADVVVAGVQWNRAPFRPLSTEQRALARGLVEAGADVVVGTGVVTLGAVEKVPSPRGDAVIAWSMGSLLSSYGSLWRGADVAPPAGTDRLLWDASTRDVALVRAQFEVGDGGRLALVTLTANAMWMQRNPDGVRVVPLRALTEYDVRVARARVITATLGADVRVRQ